MINHECTLIFSHWSPFDFQNFKRCTICSGCTCWLNIVRHFFMCVCVCVCVFCSLVITVFVFLQVIIGHAVSSVINQLTNDYYKYVFFVSQVKVAILKYIETLTLQMEAPDFVNSSETRLAVSRIITWTTEPKSSDVRKVLTQFIVETVDTTDTSQASGKKCHPGWFSNTHKHRIDGVDCSRSLCNWEECILCVTGSPVGTNLTVPAQHSRVHNAAGSFAQNISGRCHQAASKPPEEYWQRCTGKTPTRTQTHRVSQSTQSLHCKVYCCPYLFFFLFVCFFVASSGTNGQPSDTPHPSISSQLVQPGHFPHQHFPEHPFTKVLTHSLTHD